MLAVKTGKVVDQTRIRVFHENNYVAIYEDASVARFYIRDDEPMITPLPVPEFMDIKITNECDGGCPYCYQNSTRDGLHAPDPVGRLASYFEGKLEPFLQNPDYLPFQVALGGGEPTLHPEFYDVCEFLANNFIVPNYTTNGLHLDRDILTATERFCGSAAVTCHPHLDDVWPEAFDTLTGVTRAALHVMVSDQDSIMRLKGIVSEYASRAYCIVVLPFMNQGRAAGAGSHTDYEFLGEMVGTLTEAERRKIAWGAKAYQFIKDHPLLKNELSLYEPEAFSLYLDLTSMKEYPSSFDEEI